MTLYVDLTAETLVVSDQSTTPLGTVRLHQGDNGDITLVFLEQTGTESAPYDRVEIPAAYSKIHLGVRPKDDLDEDDLLCLASDFVETGSGATLRYVADFNRHTEEIAAAFTAGGETATSLACLLDIELSDTDNTVRATPVKQAATTITRDIYRGDEGEPASSAPPYPDADELLTRSTGILFLPTVTGLTGGTATDLDAVATTALTPPRLVAVVVGDALRIFRLSTGTDAEDGDATIRPDDYATTTNEKVWKSVL